MIKSLPPELINGSGIPVVGNFPKLISIFNVVCIDMIRITPDINNLE